MLDRELLGHQASHDLDRLQIVMDIEATGTSGYQGVDWIREHRQLDLHVGDHRRMVATMSFADDDHTADRLIACAERLASGRPRVREPPQIELPSPGRARAGHRHASPRRLLREHRDGACRRRAAGRVSAEQITPYPPGIPAVVPGEQLNDAVIAYLRSGADAGMTLPDPTDPKMHHFRVVA